MEADERDRQREKEEIEDVRRRLLEEGHEDVDHEIAKVSYPLLFATSTLLFTNNYSKLLANCCEKLNVIVA